MESKINDEPREKSIDEAGKSSRREAGRPYVFHLYSSGSKLTFMVLCTKARLPLAGLN